MAAARGRGWDAEGCEPNAWLAQWGAAHYGIVIRQGSVFDHQYAEGSFDAVTLWDVIEHTLNPAGDARTLPEALEAGVGCSSSTTRTSGVPSLACWAAGGCF